MSWTACRARNEQCGKCSLRRDTRAPQSAGTDESRSTYAVHNVLKHGEKSRSRSSSWPLLVDGSNTMMVATSREILLSRNDCTEACHVACLWLSSPWHSWKVDASPLVSQMLLASLTTFLFGKWFRTRNSILRARLALNGQGEMRLQQ